jgi:transcription elongation factor GreA
MGSPIARALIGKEAADVVTVKTPGGNVDYEIISIKYI